MPLQHGVDAPDGVFSLLDTDLYKLTMQCAILQHFPSSKVTFKFTNRTPHMRLTKAAYAWLQDQVEKLGNITVTDAEVNWLRHTCPYLTNQYLEYLRGFHLRPAEQVDLVFTPAAAGDTTESTPGDVSITIQGIWTETILYEIPLLALTSEAYFKFVDRDWSHEGQVENAKRKGAQLLEAGCVFSEFGSRRRRDYKTHDMVIQGLIQAQKDADANGKDWKGKLSGTSNVHFAMKHNLDPVGTVAHEWIMGIAAITQDYRNANEIAMRYWIATFGRGTLAIALTDTFGTPNFLRAFSKAAPKSGHIDNVDGDNEPPFAAVFTGVRQDSGDPLDYLKLMSEFYKDQKIEDKKVIVFSDSLNIERCIKYKDATESVGLAASFGIGTFLTNDYTRLSTGDKSVPLNIVIKLSKADGQDAIKLSDDVGKNMGDGELIRAVKAQVGYQDKSWVGGNEAHRWDKIEG